MEWMVSQRSHVLDLEDMLIKVLHNIAVLVEIH